MGEIKIVFVYGKQPSSTLTMLATGSTCYHVGFTDGYHFWDMNLIRRRRLWKGLCQEDRVILKDAPVPITAEYLNWKLDTDESRYGYLDYLLFSVRWLYHLLGQSTRNMGGKICSELVEEDLKAFGWLVQFAEVPSPADIEVAILGRKNAIVGQ